MTPVLRTLCLTDVVDSTRVATELGDARNGALWDAHDRLARALVAAWNGTELERTDGIMVMFDGPAEAVAFALAYQVAVDGLTPPLVCRAGIHTGPVVARHNPAEHVARGAKRVEVDGLAIAVTARVMSVARGGQVLLTEAAKDALGTPPAAMVSHGHWRMKGVQDPIELFEVGAEGSAFTPPADGEKVYRVVREGDHWLPRREVRRVLPADADGFVGRQDDLRALARLVEGGARLVTVLGPGGTGKTRLVRQFAWTWLGDFAGGVYFCDLAEERDALGVVAAVARALDVPLGNEDPVVQLGHSIAGRGDVLLLLDNFEQVAAHAAATLGRWLARAPKAVFVVTSRERLALPGEQLLQLEPLPEAAAMQLFELRAKAQQPGFAITPANQADVREIVRTLDGLPLAVELAAARIRVLAPAQLRERLKERFKLLAGARGAQARQGTLRAAIDWSWDLAAPWEQAALAQLAVFEGGFGLDAAEVVVDLEAWPDAPFAMDVVQALVDKSLLRMDTGRAGEARFGMYASIQEYAREKLRTEGAHGGGAAAEQAAHLRHGGHFAGFGADSSLQALDGHGGGERRTEYAAELANIVVACRRALARHDVEVAVAAVRAAWIVWAARGPFELARDTASAVLSLSSIGPAGRANVERIVGLAERMSGRANAALPHLEAALALHREQGNRSGEASVLGNLGLLHMEQGRAEAAVQHFEDALATARAIHDRTAEGVVLGNLAVVRRRQGRIDEALAQYHAALAIHREVGNRREEGVILGNLGLLHLEQGRMDEASARCEEALAVHREVGNLRGEGFVLAYLGRIHLQAGRLAEASAHLEGALTRHRDIGNRHFEGVLAGTLALLRQRLGDDAGAQALFESGEALLRARGDRLELARLLCARAEARLLLHDPAGAAAALDEATRLGEELSLSPTSEVVRLLTRVRGLVDAAG